jgi:hypothetical protein
MINTTSITITPDLLVLIGEVDEFKGAWRASGMLAPERLTMSDAVTLTGASRNTLKEHLRMLVVRRYLVQHGVGRGTWYSLP